MSLQHNIAKVESWQKRRLIIYDWWRKSTKKNAKTKSKTNNEINTKKKVYDCWRNSTKKKAKRIPLQKHVIVEIKQYLIKKGNYIIGSESLQKRSFVFSKNYFLQRRMPLQQTAAEVI